MLYFSLTVGAYGCSNTPAGIIISTVSISTICPALFVYPAVAGRVTSTVHINVVPVMPTLSYTVVPTIPMLDVIVRSAAVPKKSYVSISKVTFAVLFFFSDTPKGLLMDTTCGSSSVLVANCHDCAVSDDGAFTKV